MWEDQLLIPILGTTYSSEKHYHIPYPICTHSRNINLKYHVAGKMNASLIGLVLENKPDTIHTNTRECLLLGKYITQMILIPFVHK